MSSSSIDKKFLQIKNLQQSFLRETGLSNPVIALQIDPSAESYFQVPICGGATYFTTIGVSDKKELADAIRRLWPSSDNVRDKQLFDRISSIAFELMSSSEGQSPDLSNFIYTLH